MSNTNENTDSHKTSIYWERRIYEKAFGKVVNEHFFK